MSDTHSNQSKKSQFSYNGRDEKLFYKKVIRLLYDAEPNEIVFINGDCRDLTKDNVCVKCG